MTKPLSYLESYLSSPQISLLKNKKTKHHEEMDHTSIQRFGLAEKKKKNHLLLLHAWLALAGGSS